MKNVLEMVANGLIQASRGNHSTLQLPNSQTLRGIWALSTALLIASTQLLQAQIQPGFRIEVEEAGVTTPGVQSFAWGRDDQGNVLIAGGRTDGLHRRQPFATFDPSGNNTNLMVFHPDQGLLAQASVTGLATGIAEQLQSTNMNFQQVGAHLILTGGYGWSATQGAFVTHDKLTVIDVPGVIQAIINQQPINPYIRQATDARVQITGGYLEEMNDTLYLVGGQLFEGAYNPMGPTHGPGFTQQYANSIKAFQVDNLTQGTPAIIHYRETVDSVNLHRRDYNLGLGLRPNGAPYLTAFSGVFQYTADLPWLDVVEISNSAQYSIPQGFEQKLNQYHTAHVGIWDSLSGTMHTVFFGGIGRYYPGPNGDLIDDTDVPFVNTISMVTRTSAGTWHESYFDALMPAYQGAGSEFIPNLSAAYHSHHPVFTPPVAPTPPVTPDTVLLGWVMGGIHSSAQNIFFINTGAESWAETQLLAVYWIRDASVALPEITPAGIHVPFARLYPNPTNGPLVLDFTDSPAPFDSVHLRLRSMDGRLLVDAPLQLGSDSRKGVDFSAFGAGTYLLELSITDSSGQPQRQVFRVVQR